MNKRKQDKTPAFPIEAFLLSILCVKATQFSSLQFITQVYFLYVYK